MTESDAQQARIDAIFGNDEELSFEHAIERFYQYLIQSLQLPCNVSGIEDFRWEAYYVLGPGDEAEYEKLCKTQPSYHDTFELLSIEKEMFSEWMLFDTEDLAARVRRKSDDKQFYLGLAEVEAVEQGTGNYQILDASISPE